jgi:hypothetical protein
MESNVNESLKENGFLLIPNFLDKDLCNFAKVYFKIKADTMDYKIDEQCPLSKSFYGDAFTEAILLTATKNLSNHTGIQLVPQYSYTRIYETGEELVKHKDRPSCEYTATICLGKPYNEEVNPICIENKNDPENHFEVELEEGDLLIFTGTTHEHWRPPLENSWYLQTFIHYTDANGPYGNMLWDGRLGIGFKK